jgi:hypothetical protein
MNGVKSRHQGFALPSVIITSLVMFTVLVAMVGSVSSVRVTLDSQYYQALARDAAESGAKHAKDCLTNAGYTLNEVLTPAKDCLANVVGGQNAYTEQNTKFRTTYEATLTAVGSLATSVDGKHARIVGKTELLRATGGGVWKTYTVTMNVQASLKIDQSANLASQRFWCFGKNAGLDFGPSGTATPTPIRCDTTSAVRGLEGTTVVSDQYGVLKFWSNGIDIYDANGDDMLDLSSKPNWSLTKNGYTFSGVLAGGYSSTQAATAFPMNSARTKYGIVSTTGQTEWGRGELYLHTVDMTLNGGLGAIVDKNVKLGAGTLYASEALGAVPNADGTGYYVYTYAVNKTIQTITGFLVKTDGTVTGPIVKDLKAAPATASTTVCTDPQGITVDGTYGYGTFNFTEDYSKMLLMIGGNQCAGSLSGTAYLITPNRGTGALTVDAYWTTSGNETGSVSKQGYSADFSPDEKYAYVTQKRNGSLTRYDIQSMNSATIKASEWVVANASTNPSMTTVPSSCTNYLYYAGGQIRQGPDGRMYIADNAFQDTTGAGCPPNPGKISYISNPDSAVQTAAGIGYVVDGITLPINTYSGWGLPQMVTVFTPEITIY